MKKRNNFFRSLRFRILVILIILGIVPGVIVTYTMLHNYQDRAVSMLTETVRSQCEILSNLIIKENYLNDTSSETVNRNCFPMCITDEFCWLTETLRL